MAQYTNLDKTDFQKILANYNITQLISESVLSGGSENTNYHLVTEQNQFVLTVCEQKTEKTANELAQLLEHLTKNNFATSKIIHTTKNQLITFYKDKPILLKEYISGEVIEDLSFSMLDIIGQELGKLHQIEVPDYLPENFNYGIQSFHEVEKYATDSDFQKWLFEIRKYIVSNISSNLPKALIHGDLFYNNVIIKREKNQATIMDFEEACNYYRVYDLGMSIVGLCQKENSIELKKVHALLNGYQQHIQLLPDELKSLKAFAVYAAAATAFWRHRQFNFIRPETNYKNRYLAMKNIADEIWELSDDAFIDF